MGADNYRNITPKLKEIIPYACLTGPEISIALGISRGCAYARLQALRTISGTRNKTELRKWLIESGYIARDGFVWRVPQPKGQEIVDLVERQYKKALASLEARMALDVYDYKGRKIPNSGVV